MIYILESDLYKRLSGASLASRLTISTFIANPDGNISKIEAKAKASGGDMGRFNYRIKELLEDPEKLGEL